jgi:magnesium transporter
MSDPAKDEAPATPAVDMIDEVTPALVRGVLGLLEAGRDREVQEAVASLTPSGVAWLLEQVSSEERRLLVAVLKPTLDPETYVELDETVRDEVLDALDSRDIAAAARQLDTDDAAALIDELPDEKRPAVLAALPADERGEIERVLAYPEDSAGRLMQRELVKVPSEWTVGQVIDWCREAPDLPDDVYDLFVVDAEGRLVGSIKLGRMLRTKRPVPVTDIVDPDIPSLPVSADQEEVAHVFRDHNLVSCPVVDSEQRLLGVIMVDDVVDVIDEEAEEDLMSLAGVQQVDVYADVLQTVRSRMPWLLVNLGTAFIASSVIGRFEGEIEKLVALAVLMPIVASLGGNAGTQALTVAVRALATGELTRANALRFVGKELTVGGLNGLSFAVLVGVVTSLWFGDWRLGAVIGAAVICNLVVAGLAGTGIPLGLNRMGIDPAVSSGVFLTAITDVVGFLAFLGLAAWLLL